MRYILLTLLFSLPLWANETIALENDESITKKAEKEKFHSLFDSKHWRTTKKLGAIVSYSPFDLWIPSKIGATVLYNPTHKVTYDLELLRGSIPTNILGVDIGAITDTRISLIRRSFSNRTSFNFFYGAFYNSLKAFLGDDLLATLSGVSEASFDLVEVQNLGVTVGLGNRWQLKNRFVFGFDWFQMNLPLANLRASAPFINETSDGRAKDTVETFVKILRHAPTFVFLKLQVGISF